MKRTLLFVAVALLFATSASAQEYKIITVVESIVPMGLGRSRIVEHQEPRDYKTYTTERVAKVEGKKKDKSKKKQSDVKRSDAKIEKLSETKLLNFYSGVGINFQNIASNDALISDKINSMIKEGWALEYVTSGVESVGSKDDKAGIFITRLIFKK